MQVSADVSQISQFGAYLNLSGDIAEGVCAWTYAGSYPTKLYRHNNGVLYFIQFADINSCKRFEQSHTDYLVVYNAMIASKPKEGTPCDK